jgi:hypothetical protein
LTTEHLRSAGGTNRIPRDHNPLSCILSQNGYTTVTGFDHSRELLRATQGSIGIPRHRCEVQPARRFQASLSRYSRNRFFQQEFSRQIFLFRIFSN